MTTPTEFESFKNALTCLDSNPEPRVFPFLDQQPEFPGKPGNSDWKCENIDRIGLTVELHIDGVSPLKACEVRNEDSRHRILSLQS